MPEKSVGSVKVAFPPRFRVPSDIWSYREAIGPLIVATV